ncbi:hypothetical protein ACVDG8_012095 [Mesorhizobium sp. ORM8.1]
MLNHHGLLPDADKPEWNFDIKGHGYTALTPQGATPFGSSIAVR